MQEETLKPAPRCRKTHGGAPASFPRRAPLLCSKCRVLLDLLLMFGEQIDDVVKQIARESSTPAIAHPTV